jgi:hypothetical protein
VSAGRRIGTRDDHERFCEVEGWEPVRSARGKLTGHHATYELALPDGRVLRTRISRPVDATVYGVSLWDHILRDQLDVTEDEFWTCAKDRQRPDRSPASAEPENALPLGLVLALQRDLGLSEDELKKITKDDAVARLNEHWAKG